MLSEELHFRTIAVIGGGFAGATLIKRLQHRLPGDCRIVLISEESYTTFNPMLPEAVGASVFPEHVVAPLREIVRLDLGHRFIMGRVTAVDLTVKSIRYESLAGPRTLPYHHVVLAFGNRARLDFIPGMAAHALPLKTIGDAMEIRNMVLRRLARAELETDLAVQARLTHFAVIGGGFSGVEVAGELIDCLRSIQRYYPGVPKEMIRVTLVQDLDRLLPELPAALGLAAQKSLQQRDVAIMLGRRATTISSAGAILDDGSELAAGTVICSIGTRPNALIDGLGLPTDRGRLSVAPDMSVPGQPGLWALGDCAAVPNQQDDKISPPTAQFAVRQAIQLADNLLDSLAGATTHSFRYKARGMMAAIGHMNGVAQIGGIGLSGVWAWFLWRAYYLWQMPTFGRKLRIFVEWSWGMFFPADITHLRFTRSKDVPPS